MFLAHRRRRPKRIPAPTFAVEKPVSNRRSDRYRVIAAIGVFCCAYVLVDVGLPKHRIYGNYAPTLKLVIPDVESGQSLSTDASDYSNVTATQTKINKQEKKGFHFAIGGFPKVGTTALLFALNEHPETSMSRDEVCKYNDPSISDREGLDSLDEEIAALSSGEHQEGKLLGFKCPHVVQYDGHRGVERLREHSPKAKLVLGVRHPVDFLQSYYNYRVKENYAAFPRQRIPRLEKLVGSKSRRWKNVYSGGARYELFLMLLGKTNMTTDEMQRLREADLQYYQPTEFPVFLYSLDQMEDTNNKERYTQFLRDLSNFLELKEPLSPLAQANKNDVVENGFKETIDICDDRYKTTRILLTSQAIETERWIRTSFLSSPDVTVSNREHFLSSISKWTTDPCIERALVSQ